MLYNDFPSDTHRRVAGNLAQPRTLGSLMRELDADQHALIRFGNEDVVEAILRELEHAEDIVCVGELVTPEEYASASRRFERAITLHPEKETLALERASAQPKRYLLGGVQWLLSEQGHAKLTGPAPPELIPEPPRAPEEPEPVELGRLRGFLRWRR